MLRLTFLGLFCMCLLSVEAQQLDSVQLDEVQVFGAPISKYSAGAKVKTVSSKAGQTLNLLLEQESPIYFKTYGNGGLSTAAFRGTSASQTAVLWNGIPVNSPTLGQTDFALWPAFLLDDVAIQFGSSGSLYGSGAIGGTILLESTQPQLSEKGINLQLQSKVGSFGQYTNGIKSAYKVGNWTGVSKVFHHQLENDFEYPLKGRDIIQTQQNAAIEQYGVSQDFYYQRNQQSLSFHGHYMFNDREVQPSIASNSIEDRLKDTNWRLAVKHGLNLGQGELNSTVAYINKDQQFYNSQLDDLSEVTGQQISGLTSYELSFGSATDLRIGTNVNHFIAETSGYSISETQADLFTSLTTRPVAGWDVSLNLRQNLAEANTAIAPSLGMSYTIAQPQEYSVKLTSQMGRSFRIPTLNDRFWEPGGNPDLNVEESINLEFGLSTDLYLKDCKFNFNGTFYNMWVDEWIIWIPNTDGVWSPDNIREVKVTGVEVEASFTQTVAKHLFEFKGSYSYTRSVNETGLAGEDGSEGKQLPYVPVHQYNISANWNCLGWRFFIGNAFTDERFTTDDNASFSRIDSFSLWNAELSRNLKFDPIDVTLSFRSTNLGDIYYENLLNRAMPGRAYIFSLTLNL